jgi:two-component system, OmpR family, sensor histidine kinase MtrB
VSRPGARHRVVVAPRRLRRRLTLAFVLVAGISAGILAAGSYALVRQARLGNSAEDAVREARESLRFAALNPETNQNALADEFSGRGFEWEGRIGGRPVPGSSLILDLGDVPGELRALVRQGTIAYQRTAVAGVPYLVVGGGVPGRDTELYFFFSEEEVRSELSQLATVLGLGWVGVVLVAGLIGRSLARRTLDPVARASEAARSLSEGLLDTRLPVETDDELGAWAASFNEMADALEGKIQALSEAQARERRFTSDVAHELRTPLAALVGEASLLQDQLDRMPEDARRPAEMVVRDVARLRRLVDDLMEISRLDAGGAAVRREPVSVDAVIRSILRSRGWDERAQVLGESFVLETDRRRLERIAGNLIGNALEHGGHDVTVRMERTTSGARLEVSDRGPGIPADALPQVFERFYKADPSRTGTGSGLGLAIARENARLLGGDIEVWSEPGLGTRFTVHLPGLPPGDDDASGTAPERASNGAETSGKAVTEPLPAGDGGVPDRAHDGLSEPG